MIAFDNDQKVGTAPIFSAVIRYKKIGAVPIFYIALFLILILSGCKTMSSVQGQGETEKDTKEALSAVAGAISGKTLDEEDLRDLEKQIRTDEEAQSAIQAVTGSVSGKTPVVKYCPITGKRYAPNIEYCPEHGVKLKVVEP